MHEKEEIQRHFKGVIDTTLREGFQFSGAGFSIEDQKGIFRRLARIGVDYVEMANPAQPEIRKMITDIIGPRNGRPVRVLCHIRNHPLDVERAAACGADGVNILCTADGERLAGMGLSRDAYLERLARNLETARCLGLETRVGIEDFFGQSAGSVRDIHGLAERSGAARIAVADTLGRVMGWEVESRIRKLRDRTFTDIEVHFHNDLGHAVGNAVAALRAGANWVSASLLGIGERTGITPLSTLLVNLYILDPDLVRKLRPQRPHGGGGLRRPALRHRHAPAPDHESRQRFRPQGRYPSQRRPEVRPSQVRAPPSSRHRQPEDPDHQEPRLGPDDRGRCRGIPSEVRRVIVLRGVWT